jgi:hypothetical protein
MELLNNLGAERDSEPAEGLGVGNLLRPYPGELARSPASSTSPMTHSTSSGRVSIP